MSRSNSVQSGLRKGADVCRQIFWQANQDEINNNMVDEDVDKFKIGSQSDNDDDEPLYRGKRGDTVDGDEAQDDDADGTPSIDAGLRSPRWFERIENQTQENRKRSIQNQNLLQRVDFRTVWIARILVGLLIALIGSIATQILI